MFFNKYPYTDFHELNLDWLIEATNDMNSRVTNIEEEFAKIKVLTKEEIQAMIDATCLELKEYVDAQDQSLHDLVTVERNEYVTQKLAELRLYIDAQDSITLSQAIAYVDEREVVIRQYVDDKLIESNYMTNPLNGLWQDVREVVDDIITTFHRVNAISAKEYDDLVLTASAYDVLNITAFNYDYNAKTILENL